MSKGRVSFMGGASALAIGVAITFALFKQYPLRAQLMDWSGKTIPEPHREWSNRLLSLLPSPPVGESLQTPDGKKRVMVFMNGEHTEGVDVLLDPENDAVEILDTLLTPKLGCKRVVEMPDRNPDEPCKVYNGMAQRVTKVAEVTDGESLYLVPPDRLFVWPTVKVGRRVVVPHVKGKRGAAMEVETLSLSPRLYMLHNFVNEEESNQIIKEALEMSDDDFKLKRSSTGTKEKSIAQTRTSENAFITASETAIGLKKRIFALLGMKYVDTWADGLQVLRYNVSKGYIDHYDYLDESSGQDHSFDSGHLGTNRFATVVLYLNDVEAGGETVFTLGDIPDGPEIDVDEAIEQLRNSEEAAVLAAAGVEKGSWEERLTALCRTRLAVKPKQGSAILFYNQVPDGKRDRASRHGACPVLAGQKWAANLWVWNGPRYGYTELDDHGRTVERKGLEGGLFKILLTAKNIDVPGAALYYENQFWKEWEPGHDLRINSFTGHKWNARVGDTVIKSWALSERRQEQTILLSRDNLDAPLPKSTRKAKVDENDPLEVNRRWHAERLKQMQA
ncbi:hypothetical protein JKP88DRAFT_101011 [Tribonema minus]|uniref:Fe2OG dioxygenase domain-containing protein n=1 Tax=Tribonema minus TaxID=303371 RepID=A0A835YK64_9STRA|nr:hypothetical protein JKP88DRAFT_101011 [Tribonema minus]